MANKPNIRDRLAGKGRSFVTAAIQPVSRVGDQSLEVEETEKSSNPEIQKTDPQPTPHPAVKRNARKLRDGKPKPTLVKVSFEIRPDQITLLEEIRLEARKRGEKPPSKYDLAVEAFDLLAKNHGRK